MLDSLEAAAWVLPCTLATAWVVMLMPRVAQANGGGRPGLGCVGCHGGGDLALSLSASPAQFDPGDEITVTLTVGGGGSVAGVFIAADTGSFTTIGGQLLAEVPAGLTHTQPKALSGGDADFVFRWRAPDSPGAVRFEVTALVGNGNGGSSGDQADEGAFDLVFGCEPAQLFYDFDGDGFGRDDSPRTACANAPPANHAPEGGDCDDTRDTVHPGAVELCNQRDDDCDVEIDEDAIPITLYPDADGDGYYGQVESTSPDVVMGCVGTPDYAGEPGDCEPGDPTKHPGAEEVCNLYDDNCDGRVDERVRPICGVGWCAREAWTCDPANCEPGPPQDESCNLLDDDCDDALDEDVQCAGGDVCIAGECRVAEAGADGGEDTTSQAVDDGATGDGTTAGSAGQDGSAAGCGCTATDPAPLPRWLLALPLGAVGRRRATRP